jgi:hypothetical protein
VPEGALSLKSINYPDQGHHGDRPLLGKIPMAGPGIEPGTSCLVVRSPDHQAMRLVPMLIWKYTFDYSVYITEYAVNSHCLVLS